MHRGLNRTVKNLGAGALRFLTHNLGARRLMFNALRLRRPEIMNLRDLDEARFLAYLFQNIESSKAQILQDLWVSFELREKNQGFFVEFGATNGLKNSNTWLLETQFGWSGILAEPNSVWHAELNQNRKCIIDQRCVYSRSGETVSFVSPEDPELSAVCVSADFDHFAEVRKAGSIHMVETVSLNDLLGMYKAPDEIDYVSIDTEGSEYEILSTFHFNKRRIKLFSIEHNHTAQEGKIDELMARHHYRRRFPEFSQWDAWYVHQSL